MSIYLNKDYKQIEYQVNNRELIYDFDDYCVYYVLNGINKEKFEISKERIKKFLYYLINEESKKIAQKYSLYIKQVV